MSNTNTYYADWTFERLVTAYIGIAKGTKGRVSYEILHAIEAEIFLRVPQEIADAILDAVAEEVAR